MFAPMKLTPQISNYTTQIIILVIKRSRMVSQRNSFVEYQDRLGGEIYAVNGKEVSWGWSGLDLILISVDLPSSTAGASQVAATPPLLKPLR